MAVSDHTGSRNEAHKTLLLLVLCSQQSHPVRVRELKLLCVSLALSAWGSHSVRVRELKHEQLLSGK